MKPLTAQAVRPRVHQSGYGPLADETLLVSLRAALLVGLRELLGGEPDHLDVTVSTVRQGSRTRHLLVLHDLVPGGTGYLAQLRHPEQVQRLLGAALTRLETCRCAVEPVPACHRCLLAHTPPAQAELARRDRAVELLRAVLNQWDPQPVEGLDVIDDTAESPLEVLFRAAVHRWLAGLGVPVAESAEPRGPRWEFRLPTPDGGTVSWRLQAQVDVEQAGCRPDFLLSSPAVQYPIAVFLDGATFHTSGRANRLADDAGKRTRLRELGHLVWNLTHEDVTDFLVAQPQWATSVTPTPTEPDGVRWAPSGALRVVHELTRRVAQVHRGRSAGPPVPAAALGGDALSVLLRFLQAPERSAWLPAARAAALSLVQGARRTTSDGGDLARLAGEAARIGDPPDAGSPAAAAPTAGAPGREVAVLRTLGGAGLVVAQGGADLAVDLTLAVDDRPDVIGSPDQVAAWRDWLALANILQLADDDPFALTLTTSTALAGARKAPTRPERGSPVEAEIAALLADTDTRCHRLVHRLSPAAARAARAGHETDDGLPLEIAWPQQRIAVVLGPDPDVDTWLSVNGGTRIVADDRDVEGLLAASGLLREQEARPR